MFQKQNGGGREANIAQLPISRLGFVRQDSP